MDVDDRTLPDGDIGEGLEFGAAEARAGRVSLDATRLICARQGEETP